MFGHIRYHIVRYGDTLSSLAERYYGDPNLFGVIYQANRLYIQNMNQLTPLQKVAIPHIRTSVF